MPLDCSCERVLAPKNARARKELFNRRRLSNANTQVNVQTTPTTHTYTFWRQKLTVVELCVCARAKVVDFLNSGAAFGAKTSAGRRTMGKRLRNNNKVSGRSLLAPKSAQVSSRFSSREQTKGSRTYICTSSGLAAFLAPKHEREARVAVHVHEYVLFTCKCPDS